MNIPASKFEYYLRECDNMEQFCKCHSRQLAAVIVKDELVIPGYNGPARNVPHCDSGDRLDLDDFIDEARLLQEKLDIAGEQYCPRRMLHYKSGQGLHLCPAVHAEVNAIVNAARMGVCTKGTWMFTNNTLPCKNCMGAIINAGVEAVVYDINVEFYPDYELSRWMAEHGNVMVIGVKRDAARAFEDSTG